MKTRIASARHIRTHFCDGGDRCDEPRHHAYRRLMDALDEVRDAAEAIREIPLPPAERRPRSEWHFDERDTHRLALSELAGLEWVLTHFCASLECALYPCSQSRASRERDRLNFERAIEEARAADVSEPEDGCACRIAAGTTV